ncbi:MAG: tRNA-dihydrouridine synthase, partial [Clostridia bacterium]|nr:tRNA-dihydrouridine synthase [Clostridia bacterium]
MEIGKLKTANNVFLAPLAGYTNSVFRQMCFNLGAGLTFTEMVSAKGLVYGSEKTRELLHI